MATIGSLLGIPENVSRYEFLVEQLLILAFDIPKPELVCDVVGPDSPWYEDTFSYIQHGIIPYKRYTEVFVDITLVDLT